MSLCGGKKKKEIYQKVIIPKGMVNPAETTIIEIPTKLQKQPVVVAKRKQQKYRPEEDEDDDYGGYSRTPQYRPQAYDPPCPPSQQPQRRDVCDHTCPRRHGAAPAPHQPRCDQACLQPPAPPVAPTYSSCEPCYSAAYNYQQPQQSASALPSAHYPPPPDNSDLAETELQELQALKQDLEDFQRARRKLLASTNSLAAKSKAAEGRASACAPMPPQQQQPIAVSLSKATTRSPQQVSATISATRIYRPRTAAAAARPTASRGAAARQPAAVPKDKYDTCGCTEK